MIDDRELQKEWRKWAFFWVKELFSNEEVAEYNEFLEKSKYEIEPTEYGATHKGKSLKNMDPVRCYDLKDIKHPLTDKLHDWVIGANNYDFGFDLNPIGGGEQLHYNVYNSERQANYDWHRDRLDKHAFVDMKLTLLINLSTQPYTGGEFQYFGGVDGEGVTIEELSTPGNAILIPSNTWHRVLPVTSGQRRTAAIFYKGPRFR